MTRKEEIINAMLELASQEGLSHVSMDSLARKVGIKKPSLYNHFRSKEEIIEAMYQYLRKKSKEQFSIIDLDYSQIIKSHRLNEVLKQCVKQYCLITEQDDLFLFYKIIYGERAISSIAAKIMVEETDKMVLMTKNLFYALYAHKKLKANDLDMLATSFAYTIHTMMDYRFDCMNAGIKINEDVFNQYIDWFSKEYGEIDEKNFD